MYEQSFLIFLLFVHITGKPNCFMKYVFFFLGSSLLYLRKIIYRICSLNDISEILLKLVLNTNQSQKKNRTFT